MATYNQLVPSLFVSLPAALAAEFNNETPWLLLGEPLLLTLQALPSENIEVRLDPKITLSGDRIVIGKGCRIHPGATIEGPVRIGRNAEVGAGAVIRGGTWLGDDCVVGTNSEVQRSILMDRVEVPQLNYVGDSILGSDVCMGVGAILSRHRADRQEITIPAAPDFLPTGRRELGAILGDAVKIGSGCVLNPGTIIGRASQVQSGVHLASGIYPEESFIKLVQTIEIVP